MHEEGNIVYTYIYTDSGKMVEAERLIVSSQIFRRYVNRAGRRWRSDIDNGIRPPPPRNP